MKKWIIFAFLLFPIFIAEAFSPYENYLKTGKETHVALVAFVIDGQEEAFSTAIKAIQSPEVTEQFTAAMIRDVQVYSRMIEGKNVAVIHFAYKGEDYLEAAATFEKVTSKQGWNALVAPHERATRYGRTWLQTEWICHIRGRDVPGEPASRIMIGTQIIPEKEMEYRSLHQAVWPGVVDQIARGNHRDLCIFMVEIDDKLVEFLYLEYVGTDKKADDAANQADPFNQRWWKITDACQKPFSDVKEGIWAVLAPVNQETNDVK